MSAEVVVQRDGAVAEIVWQRPRLNLFSGATCAAFEAAVDEVSGARAVLVRAEGPVFCGGVDVHEFADLDTETGAALMRRFLGLVHRIEAIPVPTLVAVHALNLTIGLEIALGCDLIWAAPEAEMGLIEAKVGLTPAAGGTQRLVARAGLGRATEMVFSGGRYGARELHEYGVVDQVIPADQLLDAARARCAELAAGPTQALTVAKQLLRTAARAGTAAADAITADVTAPLFVTADAREGAAAVLRHNRPPAEFLGR